MLQQQLRSVLKVVYAWLSSIVRPILSQGAFVPCTRIMALLSMCVLLGMFTSTQNAPKAFALQARPPADWSFYITSTSTSTAYTFGCDQGRADASFSPPINSEVVLDFGGQLSDGSGALATNGLTISNSQIEAVTEAFAQGYWDCTGSDSTSVLHLAIGTNNSFFDVSFAGGQTWVNEVATIQSFITAKGWNSQIVMLGANDIEPGFGDASNAIAWAQGFASVSGFPYLNYGSADGCPQSSAENGSCINGWNQFDVWYVSWGSGPAIPAPEIYFLTQSRQWAMISLYGAQAQSSLGAVLMQGPWDEHDLDTTTLTSTQAWDALWTDLNNNAATAQDMPFAMEIQRE
ncbi:MAG: hypothetical protein ACRDHZ_19455 [Ktedonobacteraceae bacterium]